MEKQPPLPDGEFGPDSILQPVACSEEETSTDRFLQRLGRPGLFQMMQFFLLSLLFIPCAMNDLIPIFYDLEPTHVHCVLPEPDSSEPSAATFPLFPTTGALERNLSGSTSAKPLELYEHWWHRPQCLDECPTRTYSYRFANGQRSIVAEMNLLCERRYLIPLAATLYFVGCAVGGPVFGWMADRFGRRLSLMIANLLYTGFNIGLLFSRDFVSFAALRFSVGFARQGLQATFLVLLLEWTHPKLRCHIGASIQFFYVIGVLCLALAAYLLPVWHHLQLILACANFMALTYYWMAPESLQWLLLNNKVEQAKKNARDVAHFNGIYLKENDYKLLDELAAEEQRTKSLNFDRRHTVLDCFKTSKIRTLTLLSCYIWFVANFGYMGISYMIGSISSNVYSNLALAGALEAIPTALTIPLVAKFGRRYPMAGYFFLATILLICAGTLSKENPAQLPLALLGRMSIVGSFSIIYVWAAELFPTSIRNNGFGVLSLAFMVGGMVAPEVLLLGEKFGMDADNLALPITIIGCATGLAALAALTLPETKDRKLPETLQDIKNLPYGFACCQKESKVS